MRYEDITVGDEYVVAIPSNVSERRHRCTVVDKANGMVEVEWLDMVLAEGEDPSEPMFSHDFVYGLIEWESGIVTKTVTPEQILRTGAEQDERIAAEQASHERWVGYEEQSVALLAAHQAKKRAAKAATAPAAKPSRKRGKRSVA